MDVFELSANRVDGFLDTVRFDPKTARYRWTTQPNKGAFVKESLVQSLLEKKLEDKSAELLSTGAKLMNGDISLIQWQYDSGAILKSMHGMSAVLGHGGQRHMDNNDWLAVGRRLKDVYYSGSYERTNGTRKKFGLKLLAQELSEGKLSPAQLGQRLKMYASAAKGSYWDSKQRKAAKSELLYSFRKTSPGETCPDCILYESWGIRKVADHYRPGDHSRCGPHCRCNEIFLTLEQAIERGYKPNEKEKAEIA